MRRIGLLSPIGLIFLASVCYAASRPADIAFRTQMIDPGYNETVAVADLNNDGKPDIISGDSWYEAPTWKKHPLREIGYSHGYIDNFTDIAMDVDGDGWIDVVQFSYFAHNIVWLKNPGQSGGPWKVTEIDNSGPTEFAFLVDLNKDGKALELLPEFDRPDVPLAWFELDNGKFVKHVVAQRSFGHGIGVGDVNGDGRMDILTPEGWLEAPTDIHAPGDWKFHPTDWAKHPIPPAGRNAMPAPDPGAPPRSALFGRMYLLDINGDGRMDMLTGMAHDYGLAWLLVDLNGDGQPDLITGKRYFAHNGADPGEREPIGLYWYEWRKTTPTPATASDPGNGGVEWIRHIVDYGGRMGGGMQIAIIDRNGDGNLDIVSGGKAGLFLAENLTKSKNTKAKTH